MTLVATAAALVLAGGFVLTVYTQRWGRLRTAVGDPIFRRVSSDSVDAAFSRLFDQLALAVRIDQAMHDDDLDGHFDDASRLLTPVVLTPKERSAWDAIAADLGWPNPT